MAIKLVGKSMGSAAQHDLSRNALVGCMDLPWTHRLVLLHSALQQVAPVESLQAVTSSYGHTTHCSSASQGLQAQDMPEERVCTPSIFCGVLGRSRGCPAR
jgi:hypothetical protein